jgi:hypothetical protein
MNAAFQEIKEQNTQFSNLIAAVHRRCLFVLRIAFMDQLNLEVLKYLQASIDLRKAL